MENTKEDALFKGRSSRSCVKMGCSLYLSNFRRILKASWIPAAGFALCASVLGSIAVIQYPQLNLQAYVNTQSLPSLLESYLAVFVISLLALVVGGLAEAATYSRAFDMLDHYNREGKMPNGGKWVQFSWRWAWRTLKAFFAAAVGEAVLASVVTALFIVLKIAVNKVGGEELIPQNMVWIPVAIALVPLSAPLLYVLTKYILDGKQSLWKSLWANYVVGMRHVGLLVVVIFAAVVLVAVVSLFLTFPALVVAVANFQANFGVILGDPLGMPSYIVPLTAVTMAFAGFVEVMVRMVIFFIGYYAYGSIEATENEKHHFNEEIQNN